MFKSRKNLIIHFLGALSLILISCFYLFNAQPEIENQIGITTEKLAKARSVLKTEPKARQRCRLLKKQCGDLYSQTTELPASVMTRVEGAEVTRLLTQLADNQKLGISNFSRSKTVDAKEYFVSRIQLKLEGDYQQLCNFVHDLENCDLVVRFEKLFVAQTRVDLPYTFEIDLAVYSGFFEEQATSLAAK